MINRAAATSEVVPLAERLKARRSELGLSQAQAARELDVARTAYRLWELEAARPSPDRWRLISRWLGVSVTTMLLAEELLSEQEATMSTAAEVGYNAGGRGDWDTTGTIGTGDFFEQARSLIASGTDAGYLTEEQSQELSFLVSRIEEQRGQNEATRAWEATELRKEVRLTDKAPRAARDMVAALAAGIPEQAREAARVLTSELVTSTIIHGAGPVRAGETIGLSVEVNRELLHVELSERSFGAPEAKTFGPADSPYGLAIVEGLSSRWGTRREDDRNITWFELDLAAPGKSLQTPADL
jgi:transcriptional regulator with XRE-family HTH domain